MSDHPLLRALPAGPYVEVDGDALFLGRDCHLVAFIPALFNKVVSNRHCVVRREGESRWMLEDLGSTNGTWIRNARLSGKSLLHTGDVFSLGKNGPSFECSRGFGGTGPDATIAEGGVPAGGGETLLDPEGVRAAVKAHGPPAAPAAPAAPPPAPAATMARNAARPDGSSERPFRAGAVPTVLLRHERTGQELTASGYTITLGRDPAAQIVIRSDEEKHISGRHAEIQFRSDGTVMLKDLDSRNGTWLNNEKVKDEVPLKVGDRVLLGAATTVLLVKRLTAAT